MTTTIGAAALSWALDTHGGARLGSLGGEEAPPILLRAQAAHCNSGRPVCCVALGLLLALSGG
jgi:hypothetical protein